MFLNSTSYGTYFANWGAKPFEKVKGIDKALLEFKFKGDSSYNVAYNKAEDQLLPPDYERKYDEKFMQEMRKKNQKGEFGSLL